jgi:citrate synthase
MSTIAEPLIAPRGLAGVVVADTSLGDVLGGEGRYHYRGHDATQLARTRSFEDVWHLLVLGALPDEADARGFRDRLEARRTLPASVRDHVSATTARGLAPLAVLQSTLPVLAAARNARPLYDLDEEARVDAALAVAAAVPSILSASYRAATGGGEAAPLPGRGIVADYLRRVTGVEPDQRTERALTAYLIATLDHGLNASTFTTRVIASTGADMESCILGGLGALSGPLHGGAPSRALDALDAVGTPERVEPFIRAELAAGRRLMGFGHAVYRTADPRSELLREVALGFGGERVELALAYERAAERLLREHRPGRDLHTNVEFYAAVVLEQCGLPRRMFTPTFAMSRVVGWSAHALEQARDAKIIRPASRYRSAS